MPVVLRQNGFEFFFFTNDHLPRHVHVRKGDDLAKITLDPVHLIDSTFKAGNRRMILRIVSEHQRELVEAWNAFFH